jgi:hypothetical protein
MTFTPNADPQPVSRDPMVAGISAKLHGATSDTTDTGTTSAKDLARERIADQDVLTALDDPSDSLHAAAEAVLAAMTKFVVAMKGQ